MTDNLFAIKQTDESDKINLSLVEVHSVQNITI